MKPILLDLFCGARGYQRAGFHVVGVDHRPQPRYAGDEFIQGDALEYLADPFFLSGFSVIHASPPCQAFSKFRHQHKEAKHADLLTPTMALLEPLAKPWVIENVIGAPMNGYSVMLCGSMFGLQVRRHRLFYSNVMIAPDSNRGAVIHGEQLQGERDLGTTLYLSHFATCPNSKSHRKPA